jgi:hypothetical protein
LVDKYNADRPVDHRVFDFDLYVPLDWRDVMPAYPELMFHYVDKIPPIVGMTSYDDSPMYADTMKQIRVQFLFTRGRDSMYIVPTVLREAYQGIC